MHSLFTGRNNVNRDSSPNSIIAQGDLPITSRTIVNPREFTDPELMPEGDISEGISFSKDM